MDSPFQIASQIAVFTALILALFLIVRLIRYRLLHTTLRKAIEADPQSATAIMDRLDRRSDGSNDARNGLVLLALGLALAGCGLILADGDTRAMVGASLFPILVGAALMIRARFAARRPDGE